MSNPICSRLPWDSDFFGYPVARVVANSLTASTAAEALKWCEREGIQFLYLLADGDVETWTAATDAGFRPVDIRVDMTLDLNGPLVAPAPPNPVFLREATSRDLEQLLPIASSAHEDSRFFADAGVDRVKARALYVEWLRRSVDGPLADVVFVAEVDGCPVSYITAKVTDGVGNIGLVGVGPRVRGRGVARAMVQRSAEWMNARGARQITVVTQGKNVTAQRVYQRCGFLTTSTRLWFHKWFAVSG